jgi:hypothetical protein
VSVPGDAMRTVQRDAPALAELLGTTLPAGWAAPLSGLEGAFATYTEYQIDLEDPGLSVVTLGEGDQFLDLVAGLAAAAEGPGSAEAFASLRRYAATATWGLKLELTGTPGCQLYVKAPLPVVEVALWLRRRGCDDRVTETLQGVGKAMGKDHTHFVGIDVRPGLPPRFQVYFTSYATAGEHGLARAVDVLRLVGLDEREDLARLHPVLAPPEVTWWASISIDGGTIVPTAKLDYSDVRIGTLQLVLEELGQDGPNALVDRLRTRLSLTSFDEVGFRYRPDRAPTVTPYLVRA